MDTHNQKHEDIKVEQTDVNVRVIAKFAVILIVVALVIHVLILGAFRLLEMRARKEDPQLSPLTPARQVAPEPRLQAMQQPVPTGKEVPFDPQTLRQNILNEEEQRLKSYGWVSKNDGLVHIPIEDAKKLLAERGIPATKPQTQPQTQESEQ
jgi:hypothetical protein